MKRILGTLLIAVLIVSSLASCSVFSRSSKKSEESANISSEVESRNTERNKPAFSDSKETEKEEVEETEENKESAEEETAEEIKEAIEEEDISEEEEEIIVSHSSGKSAARSLAKLLAGNSAYLAESLSINIQASLRTDLVENGQHPYAIVITCSDSRVPAELIFNASLGDIFVIRTAGNVVGDFEVGSVEYGAEHLGSPLIFVLGHTNCGAVTAATEGGEAGGSIKAIVDEIVPSVSKAKKETSDESEVLSKAIELNVENSINRLMESKILEELIEEGKVEIIGGVYDISTGNVKILD